MHDPSPEAEDGKGLRGGNLGGSSIPEAMGAVVEFSVSLGCNLDWGYSSISGLSSLMGLILMFRFLGSKVCGVENLPPLYGRFVMAGVVFPSQKWRYTRREPI